MEKYDICGFDKEEELNKIHNTKIDNIDIEDLKTIEFNYDNLGILKCVKYLLGVVVNDIEYMNDASDLNNDLVEYLDLGNNTKIKKEDLESIYSFIDTIYFINEYNKGGE